MRAKICVCDHAKSHHRRQGSERSGKCLMHSCVGCQAFRVKEVPK